MKVKTEEFFLDCAAFAGAYLGFILTYRLIHGVWRFL